MRENPLQLLKSALTGDYTYVNLHVTSICNARCLMCNIKPPHIGKKQTNKDLSLKEIKATLGSLPDTLLLTLSGGEPTLRDDLPRIIGYASQHNKVQMVSLPTNGILTERICKIARKTLDRLQGNTHLRITLSVLGIGKLHDRIVQVPGSFDSLTETYRRLQEMAQGHRKLNIDVAVCCSGLNKHHMLEITDYCTTHFPDASIHPLFIRGEPRLQQAVEISKEEYREVLNYLYRKKRSPVKSHKPFAKMLDTLTRITNYQVLYVKESHQMPSRCYAGKKMLVIRSNGDVYPCEPWPNPLGNLRDYDYDAMKIIRLPDSQRQIRRIQNGICSCTWECALSNNTVCNVRRYPLFCWELAKDYVGLKPCKE